MVEGKEICVVGSGIAGLSAAYLLRRGGARVTILEQASCVGMDSTSVTACGARLDIPLRVFSRAYYPNLVRLYEEVGVEYHWANYELNVRDISARVEEEDRTERMLLRFRNFKNAFLRSVFGLEILSLISPLNVGLIFSLSFWKLVLEFYRFDRKAREFLFQAPSDRGQFTLREFLKNEGFSEEFALHLLLPVFSVVCTCPFEDVLNYPCEILLDYFAAAKDTSLGSPLLRAHHGTEDVVKRLTKGSERIVTSARVVSVASCSSSDGTGKNVKVVWEMVGDEKAPNTSDRQRHIGYFDEVIMATQANASLSILGDDASEEERFALGGIIYHPNRSILHVDESMLPQKYSDRSAVNLSIRKMQDGKGWESECMIWMNCIDKHLQAELTKNVFQTWNPIQEPARELVIVDAMFQRPLMTLDSMKYLEALRKLQGKRHIWFVGAYSLFSMPLLENGVRSSIRVANALGVDYPEIGQQIHGDRFANMYPHLVVKNNNKIDTPSSFLFWLAKASLVAGVIMVAMFKP